MKDDVTKPLPCPFCGKPPMQHDSIVHLACCVDHECPGYVHWWPVKDWNRRPAEDGLAREPDHLAEYFQKLRFAPEHHLGGGDIRLTMAQQDEVVAMGRLGRYPPLEPFERLVKEWRGIQRSYGHDNAYGKCADRLAELLKSARGTKT